MLQVEIGRTTCRKTMHRQLDNCDFQTSPALKRVRRACVLSARPPLAAHFHTSYLRCSLLITKQDSSSRHSLKGHRVEKQYPPSPHMTYTFQKSLCRAML